MEIKVICSSCGTKFKFDVEPIHGRMPAPVACPACGSDTTAQANTEISNALGAVPPAAASIPTARPIPVATPLGAPPAPAAPAPGSLRINRAHETPASSGAAPPPPLPPSVPFPAAAHPIVPAKSERRPAKTIYTIVIIALALIGLVAAGYRWARRLTVFTEIAKQVAEASKNADSSDGGAKNLWYEKCAILIIQHTNHVEVADACKSFWKDKLHKNLIVTKSGDEDYMNQGEYELIPAHNGYVRILGAHEWPVPDHEALAQFLSQKFGGLVFEWRSESFADTYHFGVFDQGVKKFHAQMDIKISNDNADEIVTTTGNDYAIAHGFKPGPEGFKEFNVLDADKITQNLGLKLWDEPEGIQTNANSMMLKESGPAR